MMWWWLYRLRRLRDRILIRLGLMEEVRLDDLIRRNVRRTRDEMIRNINANKALLDDLRREDGR